MKLNLASRFAVQDYRPVPCPFGTPGVVFHIGRIGLKPYQEWAQKHLANNPLHNLASRAHMKAQLIVTRPTEDEWTAAQVPGQEAAKAKLEAREAKYVEALERAMEREKVDLGSFDVGRLMAPEGVAKFLIRDIEGLTDEESGTPVPVSYSYEVGMELLTSTVPISEPIVVTSDKGEPETIAAVGAQLGHALKAWVIAEASLSEKYRETFLEEAAKN